MCLTLRISFLMYGILFGQMMAACSEKPMVVIVPSYNNHAWYTKNLDSIFKQEYSNYRVIYIDDCSSDHTADLVESYIKEKQQEWRVTLIKNELHMGALYNHYTAAVSCANNEIIVQLDGDDWFAHSKVLQTINEAYQNEKVWLTYGQYETFPDKKKGIGAFIHPEIIEKNNFREYVWVTTALRTFYAGLFKQIKLEDLLHNGLFMQTACDVAFMFPMIEMCGGNFKFIQDVVYIYNQTVCNDFKVNRESQLLFDKIIRTKKRYSALEQPPFLIKNQPYSVDLIIFAQNPINLSRLMSLINKHVSGINNIYVMYQADLSNEYAYNILKNIWNEIIFIEVNTISFKAELIDILDNASSEYISFLDDTFIINDSIDMQRCLFCLKQTHAYCFCFNLGKKAIKNQRQPPLYKIEHNIYFWQLARGQDQWLQVHNFMMTLFHKKSVRPLFKKFDFNNSQDLVNTWAQECIDLNNVALCHEDIKIS